MKKILVVDDQKDNVFVLEERLTREGFEVLSAYDGPTCLTLASEESPDLILLDVMMPGMPDGLCGEHRHPGDSCETKVLRLR